MDYICVDDCALKSVQSAYILEREELVESDHAVIGADVEWKRKRKARRNMRTTRKKSPVHIWDVYGSQMEQREYKDLSSMSVAMTQVGVELNEAIDKLCENRSG